VQLKTKRKSLKISLENEKNSNYGLKMKWFTLKNVDFADKTE
jgi:hypothetical protein